MRDGGQSKKSLRRSFWAGVALALVAGCAQSPELIHRSEDPGPAQFNAQALFGILDSDMAATAYADGILYPQAGTQDQLFAIADWTTGTLSSVAASNSVMGWPGSLDLSPDGRFAYVVETKAAAEPGVEAYDDLNAQMPAGRFLTAFDVSDPAAPRLLGRVEVGPEPTSVQVSPDGRFALVSVKDDADAVVAVILENGAPTAVRRLGFAVMVENERPGDDGALFVRLSPDGRRFAVNLANRQIQVLDLVFDAAGLPVGVEAGAAPLAVGRWLSMMRWAPDGRHLLVADVGWGPSDLGAVLNTAGSLIALRADATELSVASEATVSLSPEAFEFAPGGDLLVTVNMERTYLPERLPYALFGRRAQSSLSLVAFDAASGALTVVDGPLAFEGVLPEDAVFDADGDMLAVAVYQGKTEAEAAAGWIALFRVDRSGEAPRLIPTGRRIPTPRGLHDFVLAL